MNVIVMKCKNGHFFDGRVYATCPHCGQVAVANNVPVKEEKKSIWGRGYQDKAVVVQPIVQTPVVIANQGFGGGDTPTGVLQNTVSEDVSTPLLEKNPTLDFWQTTSHSENEVANFVAESQQTEETPQYKLDENLELNIPEIKQDEAKSEVANEESLTSEVTTPLREAVKNASVNNQGRTMSYFSYANGSSSAQTQSQTVNEPVVGWLVCIQGSHFGDCFNIYAGQNSIGRNDENRIIIPRDDSISRIKHALIVYEPKKRCFYLQPGDSSGLTYLNDNYITESHKIEAHDTIELGDSKFMFVPLCGDLFSWEEYMTKGE